MSVRFEWPSKNLRLYLAEIEDIQNPRERLLALSALRDTLEAAEGLIEQLEQEAYDQDAGFGLIPEDPGS